MAEKESGVTMPTKDETGCVEESLEGGAAAEEVRDARQGGVIPVSGRPPPHHPRQSVSSTPASITTLRSFMCVTPSTSLQGRGGFM